MMNAGSGNKGKTNDNAVMNAGNSSKGKCNIEEESRNKHQSSWAALGREGKKFEIEDKGKANANTNNGGMPSTWAELSRLTKNEESWRSSSDLAGKIKKIQENAKEKVVIGESDLEEARKECKLVLYGKFFGRTPSLELVKNIMLKIWKIKSECNIVDLSAGFFAFKFSNVEDYWEVFSSGPSFLIGQTLSLVLWRENFQPLKESIEVIPVWIQFTRLPFEYLHENILPQLAAVIGRPLKIDGYTLSGTRGKFVRCGKVGHLEGNCKYEVAEKEVKEGKQIEKAEEIINSEEKLLGPWVQNKVVVEKENRSNKKNEEMNIDEGSKKDEEMAVEKFIFNAKEDSVSKEKEVSIGEDKGDDMEMLAENMTKSFEKILNNENAKEDFWEMGIDPEKSRIETKKGPK
ncbi:hypothetical protein Cni_G15870 [Canna indica]|uniref:DUF4283 domain-containing protein n=1 Tax=Canna indica TaxID=4628 RepID=A0AAQ3KHS4_9LILI|nr:hypothetical protein Cni_G15870 [Canna indica]